MSLDIEELKKDHNTNYLATSLEKILREEAEVREMLDSDESLHELASKELQTIQEERERIEKQIQDILDKEKEKEEFPNEIVLEVRAGAGGDEASLFAWELAHMYERYADTQGWQWYVNYESKSDLSGYKEASFEIKGKDVYKNFAMRQEYTEFKEFQQQKKMAECIHPRLLWRCFQLKRKFLLL
jgi:protein subunit release factor A